MKHPALYLIFVAALSLAAQAPATTANAQATQQQQQTIQQQQQQTIQQQQLQTIQQQQINQQVMRNNQANQPVGNGLNYMTGLPLTFKPSFTIAQGKIPPGTKVRIHTRAHYAQIFYTTDGWSPTTNSQLYTGPIEIDRNTVLQAIAIAPDMNRSRVARAIYITGKQDATEDASVNTTGILPAGTMLRLVTDGKINSKTAEVGDTLPLKLDEDIKVGDAVIVPKGTPVSARTALSDPSGFMGQPGDICIQVDAIQSKKLVIPVDGVECMEGIYHDKLIIASLLLADGIPAILSKGGQAAIVPGMKLNVAVTDDTGLDPEALAKIPPGPPPPQAN